LTNSQKYGTIVLSNPNHIGDKLPEYDFKVQREYTNWEEITVEADSKEQSLELAEDDDWWEAESDD
jgi:hypothetical protein